MSSWFSRFLGPPRCSESAPLREALAGKTVLLTGASFGIGAALATRLQQAGVQVLLAARTVEELRGPHAYPLDLREPASVDALAAAVLRDHGGVDVVIHNAGKSIRRSLMMALDRPHDFERCMGVNYLGPVRLQLALLPSMIARGGGQIINVSSVGVRMPPVAQWAAYLASKSAFDHWLGAAVAELRPHRIACTSVYLGLVHTRMSAPTKEYASLPGLTADEAACVLCRALIRRPRALAPWWLAPVHWLSPVLERPLEWFRF